MLLNFIQLLVSLALRFDFEYHHHIVFEQKKKKKQLRNKYNDLRFLFKYALTLILSTGCMTRSVHLGRPVSRIGNRAILKLDSVPAGTAEVRGRRTEVS